VELAGHTIHLLSKEQVLVLDCLPQDHQQPQGAQPGAAAAAAPVAAADADPSAGMAEAVQESARIPCMCGATNCCKWLLVS
jgi:hypothetical protein